MSWGIGPRRDLEGDAAFGTLRQRAGGSGWRTYVVGWCFLLLIGVGNGEFREAWIEPFFEPRLANQLAMMLLLFLYSLFAAVFLHFRPLSRLVQAFAVGGLWMGLMLAFHFGFGHFLNGLPWNRLMEHYHLSAGRLWPLVLLSLALLPPFYFSIGIGVAPRSASFEEGESVEQTPER